MHRREDWHLIDHLQIEASVDEGVGLLGIVGEQAHPPQAQILQQLDPHAVIAGIGLEAEREIGLHRVEPLILQLVGPDLLHEADAPPLLRQIDKHPSALAADHFQGQVELIATVAAEAVEQIACKAGGVQPHQRIAGGGDIPHHQHQRLLRFKLHRIGHDPEFSPARREISLRDPGNELLLRSSVADQLLDRDDLQPMVAGQHEELLTVGPVPRIIEDFAEHPGRSQAGHPGQIDCCLSVPRPPQHAPLLGHQRKEVSGANKISRPAGRIENGRNRGGAFPGGDAGAGRDMVDRNGEGGAQRRRIGFHHHRQIEPPGQIWQDRHAHLPATVAEHEVDQIGRNFLGSTDKVPLVFPVFGIDDDDRLAPPNGGHRGFNR